MRPFVTQADILVGVRRLGVAPGEVVLAHSSLSAFGHVEGGAEAVIRALLQALGPADAASRADAVHRAGTLAMPTFTWDAFHDAHGFTFDVARTPSETGRMSEVFRAWPGTVRSSHVCHSFALRGPLAQELLGENRSSFGPGSTLWRLKERDAWVLLLGVDTRVCTALHMAEEACQVPYRACRDFRDATVILPDGRRVASEAREFLRKPGYVNDFAKMEAVLAAEGVLRGTQVGGAPLLAVRLRDVFRITVARVQADPYYLLTPATRPG
jgi:aminoglycoside 3-N-acetyltransferase